MNPHIIKLWLQKEPPECKIINATQMFTEKMKTRLFLLHSNQIGQPISSSREFSEDHHLHAESMCFICICPHKEATAVPRRRRTRRVPTEAGPSCGQAVCTVPDVWARAGQKSLRTQALGNTFQSSLECPVFIGSCCFHRSITGLSSSRGGGSS